MNKKTTRILFTSVGRRVELIREFKSAAEILGVNLEIFGADITDTAPALVFCDHTVIVPRINDVAYIPSLLEYCKNNCIEQAIVLQDLLNNYELSLKEAQALINTYWN